MSDPWKSKFEENPYEGFNNIEIYKISKKKYNPILLAPTLFWTSEINGFNQAYRKWLKIPKWLPLPFYSDHGVDPSRRFQKHEIENKAKIHFTWTKARKEAGGTLKNKQIIRVQHPWISFRNIKKYTIKNNAKGTLIFFMHTNVGIDVLEFNYDEYFNNIDKLPEEYRPIVICLHMHDINKGLHKKLRKYGYPILTLGHTGSWYFIDRFYQLASNFKFATSQIGGSELYYLTEFGVRYFIYGQKPKLINYGDLENPIGELVFPDHQAKETEEKKFNLFTQFPPKITQEKKRFIQEILGMEKTHNDNNIIIKVYIQMAKIFPYYCIKIIKKLIKYE